MRIEHQAKTRRRSGLAFIRLLTIAATLLAAVLVPLAPAQAWTLKTLHSFCTKTDCADGAYPTSALVSDGAGNLYGITFHGGANDSGDGVAFALIRNGDSYKYQLLYTFCALANCADGKWPISGLIVDANGHLYGMTQGGGAQDAGTVFALVPNAHRTEWRLQTLYSFCSALNCRDGAGPIGGLTYQGAQSGVPYDGNSPLFGVTNGGGGRLGQGTAFQLTYVAGKTKRKESVLYRFCSQKNCADGTSPFAGLLIDTAGNLIGTTLNGGATGEGTVFQLSPSGSGYTETILYSFCALPDCADGWVPSSARLVRDAAGNLFGTTSQGGGKRDGGVVYQLTPNGGTWSETVLHTFCADRECTDGKEPFAGVVMDGSGALYGATARDGAIDKRNGAIYRIQGGVFEVIYSFCGGPCGKAPVGGLIVDGVGNLFGTTARGGRHHRGTVFELSP